MHAESSSPFNRTLTLISLSLAILFVIGVLISGRMVFQHASQQPIGMSALPAPDAQTPECTQLLDSLPSTLDGHRRAELVDPAPEGAAAWGEFGQRAISLRCGVTPPAQFTALSDLQEIDGTDWLLVGDATPGSQMKTFYALNRAVVVALTYDQGGADTPPEEITSLLADMPTTTRSPQPAPLASLPRAAGSAASCRALLAHLPETLGTDGVYTREELKESGHTDTGLHPESDAVWTAPGLEPVVLRCGTELPASYQPGVELHQVNDIPWFEDTELAPGSTASTWYALGRDATVAVSMPQEAAASVSVDLGAAISQHTKKTSD
ncbi:DUF3515 domain-containing protein [Corynebacterium uropygiale]|uniref:DUF3515 domain-containing protein n=1 Tax=Corynebacterium uropygiale TaxID=1775911 RepID=A0A9X1TY87_9CORY|nr:DUF3515 domain-containing protein [Corynebacterium uropygiale]MCF4007025.1 DUF3515 domain-containing protein [Corynebacterium uropygiale]